MYFTMCICVVIMGSPDLKRPNLTGIFEKQERVQELKVLYKKERLHFTINKCIETLTFTRLEVCCSQIVTFNDIELKSSFRCGSPIFI